MKSQLRTYLLTLAFTCALGVGLSGCVAVPKTHISGKIMDQPYSLTSPKNSKLTDLSIEASKDQFGVGAVKIKIGSLEAQMDPNVVATTAAGQAALLNATAQLITQSAAALGQAAAVAGAGMATGGASLAVPKPTIPTPPKP